MKSVDAIELIVKEFGRQAKGEQPFSLADRGIDAVHETVDELLLSAMENKDIMRESAVRVAATAFRFLVDIC